MSIRTRSLAVLAGAATAVSLCAATGVTAAAHAPQFRAVTVIMNQNSIKPSAHRVHAGTIVFSVVDRDQQHAHQLQIARLHKGYSLQQFGSDINKAFAGKVKYVRRIDHRVTFRGGVAARAHRPREFTVDLTAGRYLLLDTDGNGLSMLTVFGKTSSRPYVPHQAQVTALSYGFKLDGKLASTGSVKLSNVSDQPHFIEFQRVKDSTTRRDIARYVHHPSPGKPAFALRGGMSTGVISPYRHQVVSYHLPAGKYLLACFWPDDDSGMPHFFMGMWKLVRIR
jgi:hypothetical protein